MFQGSQKPARHLPDLVPSSCALAPRQTREAGFLVNNTNLKYNKINFLPFPCLCINEIATLHVYLPIRGVYFYKNLKLFRYDLKAFPK